MTVSQLKARRKTKKSSFNTYVKRRDAVKKIIKRIDDKFDDDVRDVNKNIVNCSTELQQGLKGVTKVSQICSNLESAKEKNIGSDNLMRDCRSNLSSEVTRCQSRINTLDGEIKSLESQIKAQGGIIYFWE